MLLLHHVRNQPSVLEELEISETRHGGNMLASGLACDERRGLLDTLNVSFTEASVTIHLCRATRAGTLALSREPQVVSKSVHTEHPLHRAIFRQRLQVVFLEEKSLRIQGLHMVLVVLWLHYHFLLLLALWLFLGLRSLLQLGFACRCFLLGLALFLIFPALGRPHHVFVKVLASPKTGSQIFGTGRHRSWVRWGGENHGNGHKLPRSRQPKKSHLVEIGHVTNNNDAALIVRLSSGRRRRRPRSGGHLGCPLSFLQSRGPKDFPRLATPLGKLFTNHEFVPTRCSKVLNVFLWGTLLLHLAHVDSGGTNVFLKLREVLGKKHTHTGGCRNPNIDLAANHCGLFCLHPSLRLTCLLRYTVSFNLISQRHNEALIFLIHILKPWVTLAIDNMPSHVGADVGLVLHVQASSQTLRDMITYIVDRVR
mmetsp:Transcript_33670/g.71290  ORF Transcript_33670/g.71290 Transcript_33670/m.71290 type:complete len:424 (-) Transcript_33670:50-1321(-)